MKRYLVPFFATAVVSAVVCCNRSHHDPTTEARATVDLETDRETNAQRLLADHVAFLAQHGSETRDLRWAPHQEQHMRAAFGALLEAKKHSFSVESIDCRTATCVAQLTWPSEAAARQEADSVLGESAPPRCAREIAFPAAEGAGPYTASLYFACAF